MSAYVIFEEFHLTVRVSSDLEQSASEAIQRMLDGRPFQTALRRVVRRVIRQYPNLEPIRVRISR